MRPARGLTIIEVLIAIAIVLAMAAIVVPNVAGRFGQRAFEAATDQTQSMLLMARAHAQMTSRPVEVVFERSEPDAVAQASGRLIARHFDLEDPDAIAALRASAERDADDPAFDDLSEQRGAAGNDAGLDPQDDPTAIFEPWAQLALPHDAWIQQRMPDVLEAMASESMAADTVREPMFAGDFDDNSQLDAAAPTVRLAVFLPDGSLLAGQTTWLMDDGQRIARIDLNPWSGLPEVLLIRTAAQAQAQLDTRDAAGTPDEPREDESAAEDERVFTAAEANDDASSGMEER